MSETDRKWRCPYCDGLNDWQNEVCEICGDGRRDGRGTAEEATSATEIPKTYTPRERRPEEDAPRRKPEPEAPSVSHMPSEPEPGKKKKGGIWVAAVVMALAALAGRFMADSFVNDVEKSKPTAEPLSVIETVSPTMVPQPEATSRMAFCYLRNHLLRFHLNIFGNTFSEIELYTGLDIDEPVDFPWWGKDLKSSYIVVDGIELELLFQNDRLCIITYHVDDIAFDDAAAQEARRLYGNPVAQESDSMTWKASEVDCSLQLMTDVYATTGDKFFKQMYVWDGTEWS